MRVLLPTLTAILGFTVGFCLLPDRQIQTSTQTGPTTIVDAVFRRESRPSEPDDLSIPLACLEQIDTARRAQDWHTYLGELTRESQLYEAGVLAQTLLIIGQGSTRQRDLKESIHRILTAHHLVDLSRQQTEDPRAIGRRIADRAAFMRAATRVLPDPWLGTLPTGPVTCWLADMAGGIAIARRPGQDHDTWFRRENGAWRANIESASAEDGQSYYRHEMPLFFSGLATCELVYKATERDAYQIQSTLHSEWGRITTRLEARRRDLDRSLTLREQQQSLADCIADEVLPKSAAHKFMLAWAMPWRTPRGHTAAEDRHVARADVDAIASAIEHYIVDEQKRPRLMDLFDSEQSVSAYLKPGVGRLDPWWRPYVVDSRQREITLRSAGPDMRLMTADDIIRRLDNSLVQHGRIAAYDKQGWPVFEAQATTAHNSSAGGAVKRDERNATESAVIKSRLKSKRPR